MFSASSSIFQVMHFGEGPMEFVFSVVVGAPLLSRFPLRRAFARSNRARKRRLRSGFLLKLRRQSAPVLCYRLFEGTPLSYELQDSGRPQLVHGLLSRVAPFYRREGFVQRTRPETRSSRLYPTMWRNASLASMIVHLQGPRRRFR